MSGTLNTYPPPDWLDKDFVQNALREGLKQSNLEIINYNIKPATNVGENFLSRMFRATISTNSSPKPLSIIIKCLPKGDHVKTYMSTMQFFEKEGKMLTQTIPAIASLLKGANLPNLFAELYFNKYSPDNVIVMQDLCEEGFRPADRTIGLDLDHCVLALEGLATFHAASLAAMQRDHEIKERHKLLYWHKDNEVYFKAYVEDCVKYILEWKELPPGLSEKLTKFQEYALKKMFDAADVSENELNVITHGDARTTNFLFKYDGDTPIEVKLVDFQNSCYNNPVTDVIYFIIASPSDDIKIKNIDFFLKKYYSKLLSVCESFNYSLQFSIEDLKRSFIERLAFGFIVSLTVYPFNTGVSTQTVELDDFLSAGIDTPPSEPFMSKEFRHGMNLMLPYFLENGVFD